MFSPAGSSSVNDWPWYRSSADGRTKSSFTKITDQVHHKDAGLQYLPTYA